MDPISIIKDIRIIVLAIYKIAEAVEANQAQCQSMAKRVQLIEEALLGLSEYPDNQQFKSALAALQNCLTEVRDFMEKFKQVRKWLDRAYHRKTDQAAFDDFNARLVELIPILNLALSAHQVLNQDQIERDRVSDDMQWDTLLIELEALNLGQTALLAQGRAAQAGLVRLCADQASLQATVEEHHHALHRRLGRSEQERRAAHEEEVAYLKRIWGVLEQFGAEVRAIPALPESGDAPQKARTEAFSTVMLRRDDLRLGMAIRETDYAAIYEGDWMGQAVAIKALSGQYTQHDQRELVREMQLLQRLNAPTVLRFYGWCTDDHRAYLVEEYCANGDLASYLSCHSDIPLKVKHQMVLDIAKGLNYLHQEGLSHRNLNSRHVLLDDGYRAKLTGFRFSQHPAVKTMQSTVYQTEPSFAWRAPEALNRKSHCTQQSDVYSFGIVVWELMTQQTPFAGLDPADIMASVYRGEHPPLTLEIPKIYRDLLKACWENDPKKRPMMAEIVSQLQSIHSDVLDQLLGETLYESGKKHERAKALPEAFADYHASADRGSVKALAALGIFHMRGFGGASFDKAMANDYFRRSAEGGYVRAMYNLAKQLRDGDGVPKNEEEALYWYEQAAAQGDKDAQAKAEQLRELLASRSRMTSSYQGNLMSS